MFCNQCQETLKNQGCKHQGVCGLTEPTSQLRDALLYTTQGLSFWAKKARELGIVDEKVDRMITESMFRTITNVNFDDMRYEKAISRVIKVRDELRERFLGAYREKNEAEFSGEIPEAAAWTGSSREEMLEKGILFQTFCSDNEDIRSLRQLLLFGAKGIAAYADHAALLGHTQESIFTFLIESMDIFNKSDSTVDELLQMVLKAGAVAVDVMALLDTANTSRYGHPEPTEVSTAKIGGPAILVSGHDLLDLEELLEQTKDKGVNVYTHGEMLPALAYPKFKQYKNLVGHYGSAWHQQREDFEKFGGAILMTTNCIQKPKDSYKANIFTTGLVGWEGLQQIPDREKGKSKDFTPVIERAIAIGDIGKSEGGKLTIGFAHQTVLANAETILDAVKSGALKKFVVMAGCDGRSKSRQYYTDVAKNLPKDTIILTAGCAKFRYNHLDLGTIGGLPRVIDAGQCNDSYSLAVVALKLKEVLGLDNINDLPIAYDISWYEQKAVTVLLALLHLGVKHIRLGPTLPAFLSPNVAKILIETFDIKPITTVDEDIAAMMA